MENEASATLPVQPVFTPVPDHDPRLLRVVIPLAGRVPEPETVRRDRLRGVDRSCRHRSRESQAGQGRAAASQETRSRGAGGWDQAGERGSSTSASTADGITRLE